MILDKLRDFIKWNIYYPVENFYHIVKERTSRSFSFAVRGWKNFDFESAYLYDVMAFKLQRIEKTLKKYGGAASKKDMRALAEAIKICNRLFLENHETKYFKAHTKKWGSITFEKGPMRYVRAQTEAESKQCSKELMECVDMGDRDRNKDLDRLNEILKNHQRHWWD